LRRIYDVAGDETLRATAAQLTELEKDLKYKKKYATLWAKKACGGMLHRVFSI
jgi:hypothetical protein